MKRLARVGTVLAAASWSLCAQAADLYYPKMEFDATYDEIHPSNHFTRRIMSDGKGHVREEMVIEANKQTYKLIVLKDYPANTFIGVNELDKTVSKARLINGEMNYDKAFFKNTSVKPLGAKVIDGRPCHGFATSENAVTDKGVAWKCVTQVWIGDGTHYLVRSERNALRPQDQDITALKSWSNRAPAGICSMPVGYKEVEMLQCGL
jgi:hypothetical protein